MQTAPTASSLEAALALGQLGFPVFPCRPNDKAPITKNGFKNATSDLAQIESWWGAHPDANIGLATRGLLVVDVDDPAGEWYAAHGEELRAGCGAMATTPRGGVHLYFRQPEGAECRNTTGQLAEGVDSRANGGYVIVPCSRVKGKEYTWLEGRHLSCGPEMLPDAPPWLIEQLSKPKKMGQASARPARKGGVDDDGPIPQGRRNDALTRLAGKLRRGGMEVGDIALVLHDHNRRRCQPPMDDGEVDAIAASIGRYPPRAVAQGGKILIDTDEHRVVNDAVAALSKDPDIYCRGNVLVRVVEVASAPGGSPVRTIARLEPATLRERLTLVGDIVRIKKGEEVPSHPTGWLVSAVEARGFWPGIRPLAGIADAPLLRRDGTICCESGYDPASGVVVNIPVGFPLVPLEPSLEDARVAVDALVEVVCDFRFESPEHRSAYIAAMITTIARFAFDGPSPLFLIDANVRGAGKGLLAQVISIIATGSIAPVSSAPSDTDETRKQITTAAINADRIVLYDNVEGKLGNDALDRALTCTRWRDRILGKSEQVDLPLVPTWMATGNNVMVGADTARRIIHIRLDVLEEKPEERRDFRHPDLLAYVSAERARLYVAALTIVSAFMRAGMPAQDVSPFGSFEGWSALVRGAIIWAGQPDPCLGRKQLVESADSARESLEAIISAFRAIDPDNGGIVIAPMLLELYPADRTTAPSTEAAIAMRAGLETLPGVGGGTKAPTARAVGNALRRFRRRVIAGVYLDTDADRSTGMGKRWRLYDADSGKAATGTPASDPSDECPWKS